MFENLKQATILADAKFHLPLYEKIIQERGNTLAIQVISLDTFIGQYAKYDTTDLELLYLYKEALKNLSPENAFFSSRQDADFLKACLRFLKWAHSYAMDFSKCPNHTKKEKDLKEILEKIKDIPLKEQQTQNLLKELDAHDFSHVYILKREFSDSEYIWIQFLLQHHAQFLYDATPPKKHYFSVANARLQAAVVCDEILSKDMCADEIQISISNTADLQPLLFMLQHHQIPYTLLREHKTSQLSKVFITILQWLTKKDRVSFIELIHTVYKNKSVETYLQLFPHAYLSDFSLQQIEYVENCLVDTQNFDTYKQLEQSYLKWMEEHNYLFHWNISNILEALQEIRRLYPHLNETDHAIVVQTLDLITKAYPYLHTEEDISLLCDFIDQQSQNIKPETIQGVLIATRKDITSLRPVHFLLSASAKEFPKLETKTGIFNEAYIQNTTLPSLEDRLNFQNQQVEETLNLANTLYCIVPQSTYDSKNLEESIQLNSYMGCKPVFRTCADSSVYTRPQFDLTQNTAKKLFLSQNKFTGSISRLETFGQCPLKHFIRYGLHLNEPKEWNDIRVRGSILHHILEVLTLKYGKEYINVNEDEIQSIIDQEFAFAHQLFPNKKGWLTIQSYELNQKIKLILEQLKYFEKKWHMNIAKQEQKFSYSMDWDGITIELYGYIDRIDTSSSSFCIFDYKSSDKDISIKDFEAGLSLQLITYTIAYQKESQLIPAGSFYISLKTSPETHIANKPGYRKKMGEFKAIEQEELLDAFIQNKKRKGLLYQDLSIYSDDDLFSTKKGTPSFETLKEEQEEIIKNMITDIVSGNIKADHDKNACKYCSYASICRNAQNEVEKTARIQKEDA